MRERHCVVCGARVYNANPKTKTCRPICTRKLHGKPEREYEIRQHCEFCGIATGGAKQCPTCKAAYREANP